MLNRAYSILDVKAVDERERTIRGIATTPAVDRIGDIIDPLGVKFENPLPFLWQHFHDAPIGTVEFEQPTKSGVKFVAKLPMIEEAGNLRDRIEEAWQSIKAGLIRAVSIGFRPLEYAFIENGGIRFDEVEVYELSAVTIPANSEALITSVKSIDAALRKAAGVPDPEIPPAPEPAAIGKMARVVRLNAPPASRQPFIIREIRRTQ
jgi:HK97 family phage prohead protease